MEPYLPVTVLCAIGLFVTKEIVEHLKKRSEKTRKVEAYKTLIAEECMKNAWVLKSLRSHIRFLEDPQLQSVRVESTSYGDILVHVYDKDSRGGSPIVDAHTAVFEKTVVDLAVIDSVLFSRAKDAYEALAEVTNCLSQLREFAGKNDLLHLSGLAEYSKEVVDTAENDLKSLFKFCTGKELSHKVRSFI
ncbi:Prophage PssSM-02, Orf12 [Pseudomonas syringae pv. syringae SM]|nr:Prophage PssSM-02, Orf12 [Pseudomonas syringae pv. syringae SM]